MDPLSVRFSDLAEKDPAKLPFLFPCVYAYCRGDSPVYVGETKDLMRRHGEHKKKKWFTKDLTLRAIRLADPQDRLTAETILILETRPRHNRAVKLGISAEGKVFSLQFLRSRK